MSIRLYPRSQTALVQAPVQQLQIIDVLRGLAAFAVMWYHFTQTHPAFFAGAFFQLTGQYGYLGVEVFFVISGFIIPYSLWRSDYQRDRDWQTFLYKRFLRLYPSYIFTVLATILLWHPALLLGNWTAFKPEVHPLNLLLHLVLGSEIFGFPWLIAIFWTLAIEFQYYVIAAIGYPILQKSKFYLYIIVLLGYLLPFLIPIKSILFFWFSLFNFGILTFLICASKISNFDYFCLLTLGFCTTITCLDLPVAIAGVSTTLAIRFLKIPNLPIFSSLGKISYSLYLVHILIGSSLIDLYINTFLIDYFGRSLLIQVSVLAIAIACSLTVAVMFYTYVERPSHSLAQKIRYHQP